MGEKNLFVIGLDEANRALLERTPGLADCRVHALLDYEELRGVDSFPVDQWLSECERRLASFSGSVDGVMTLLDFPATELVPILAGRLGLHGPTLEGVLQCSHKYWSRVLQQEAAPEQVPGFAWFDPYDDWVVHEPPLAYPFWVKPLNSYRSHLGFRINSAGDFRQAVTTLREELPRLATPLATILEQAKLPEEIAGITEHACLAERIISGSLCTLEGYVYDGEPVIFGVVDSIRAANRTTFTRYQYPSGLPGRVQERMKEVAVRVMRRLELDHCPFNMELFYERGRDRLWLLEINPRISQSHCELFEKVDGASHHKVMVDLALGRAPRMPKREGLFGCAAKFFIRSFTDGRIRTVPDEEQIRAVEHAVPGASVSIEVEPGQQLSELQDQDSYSYELATVYIGGRDPRELMARYRECERMLRFELG